MAAAKGNKYSSKNNRLLTDTLKRIAVQEDGKRVRKICEQVFEKAEAGDLYAANFIFDRLEGKPVSKQELSGPDGDAIPVSIGVKFR